MHKVYRSEIVSGFVKTSKILNMQRDNRRDNHHTSNARIFLSRYLSGCSLRQNWEAPQHHGKWALSDLSAHQTKRTTGHILLVLKVVVVFFSPFPWLPILSYVCCIFPCISMVRVGIVHSSRLISGVHLRRWITPCCFFNVFIVILGSSKAICTSLRLTLQCHKARSKRVLTSER